jgi:hypothetical protein
VDQLDDRDWLLPRPSRLSVENPLYEEIMRRHAGAVAAGEGGYLDPSTGFFVMTAVFLARRETCCTRGCRHCPYEYDV